MYHLRLVTFDEVSYDKENITKKSEKQHDYKNRQEKSITRRPKNTNKERKKRNTGFRAVKKKLSFASLGELIQNRTQGDGFKSLTSIKTISVDDIRKNLLDNLNAHRQRKKLKKSSKSIPLRNNDVKRRGKSQDDIKVSYAFERSKSPDNYRLLNGNPANKYGKSKYFIQRSTSDLFGVGNADKARGNTGVFPTPKRRKKKIEPVPYKVHQVYPVSTPFCNRITRLRDPHEATADHYNVVGFPRQSKVDICGCKVYVHGLDLKPCVHQNDSALNSSLLKSHQSSPRVVMLASVEGKGDGAKTTCSETSNVRVNKSKPCLSHGEKGPILFRLCRASFCNIRNYFTTIKFKCIVKALLLTIAFIAWSPCILVVAICWLLVYPFKSCLVFKEDKVTEKQMTSEACCDQVCKKQKLSTRVMKWTRKTSQRLITMVYDVYKSSIGKKLGKKPPSPCQEPPTCPSQEPPTCPACPKKTFTSDVCIPCPNPCKPAAQSKNASTNSKWVPNPNKRYVLFFDKERGWLMKPLKNNEVCNECQEFTRPEICQKLLFNRQQSRSNKTVTFSESMHGDQQTKEHEHNCDCLPPNLAYASNSINHPKSTYSPKSTNTPTPHSPTSTYSPKATNTSKNIFPTDHNHKSLNRNQHLNLSYPPDDGRPPDQTYILSPLTKSDEYTQTISRRKTLPTESEEPNLKKDKRSIRPPTRICRPCPKKLKKRVKQEHKQSQVLMVVKPKRPSRIQACQFPARKCHPRPPCRICRTQPKPHAQCVRGPKVCRVEKMKVRRSCRQKICDRCRCCGQNMQEVVDSAESSWDDLMSCDSIYISTLRKRPCFGIYRKWPSLYPAFLTCHHACCRCCSIFLTMLAFSTWFPIFLCCYLSCSLFCSCCSN